MNARKESNQNLLFGQIQEDNKVFTAMMKSRLGTGSSFRFEYTFEIADFNTTTHLSEAVSHIETILKFYTRQFLFPKVTVVKPSIFPQSMITIHSWLWNSIQPIIQNIMSQSAHVGLKFAQRELVALVERLMIVNINGNLDRNLTGPTPNALNVVNCIEQKNWPYLEYGLIDRLNWGVLFQHQSDASARVPEASRLLLFSHLPAKYRLICSQNVKSLVELELLIIRLENLDVENISRNYIETEIVNAVNIFKSITLNFINEVGTVCCEKMLDKSKKTNATVIFRNHCHILDQMSKDLFFPSTFRRLVGNEICLATGRSISAEDLWQQHVINGVYSRIGSLPDWFSAFSSLIGFRVVIKEWSEDSDAAQAIFETIIGLCKGSVVQYNRRLLQRENEEADGLDSV